MAETLWRRHRGGDIVAETSWQRHRGRDFSLMETLVQGWTRDDGNVWARGVTGQLAMYATALT